MNQGRKAIICNLPRDADKLADDIEALTTDLQAANELYKSMNFTTEDSINFAQVVNATRIIFACGHPHDAAKPPTSEVRLARRALMSFAQDENACGDIAKCLLTYPAGCTLLELSKVYSAAGVEDDACTRLFDSVLSTFESYFEARFEDLDEFLAAPPDEGQPWHPPLQRLLTQVTPLDATATSLTSAMTRWSVTAMERRFNHIEILVKNALDILKGALAYSMKVIVNELRVATWQDMNMPMPPRLPPQALLVDAELVKQEGSTPDEGALLAQSPGASSHKPATIFPDIGMVGVEDNLLKTLFETASATKCDAQDLTDFAC